MWSLEGLRSSPMFWSCCSVPLQWESCSEAPSFCSLITLWTGSFPALWTAMIRRRHAPLNNPHCSQLAFWNGTKAAGLQAHTLTLGTPLIAPSSAPCWLLRMLKLEEKDSATTILFFPNLFILPVLPVTDFFFFHEEGLRRYCCTIWPPADSHYFSLFLYNENGKSKD